MSDTKNGPLVYFKMLFGLSAIIFVLYFITATISKLLGHSLWSWVNVLRFYLGAGILFIVCCYAIMIKKMVSPRVKK